MIVRLKLKGKNDRYYYDVIDLYYVKDFTCISIKTDNGIFNIDSEKIEVLEVGK